MLYRESLKPRITGITNVSFSEITVHLKIPGPTEIMAMAGIYHSPRYESNPNDSTFVTKFCLYLDTFISQFKKGIIVGDINIHVNKPNDYIPYNYLTMLDSMDLYQVVDFPTHQSAKKV